MWGLLRCGKDSWELGDVRLGQGGHGGKNWGLKSSRDMVGRIRGRRWEGRDPSRPLEPRRDTGCSSIYRYDTDFPLGFAWYWLS